MSKKKDLGFDYTNGRGFEMERNVITKVRYETVKCKFCGEWERIVLYGRAAKGGQRYLCRKCERTFMDNKAPEKGHYSVEIVASAINQFYETASHHKICRQLKLDFGIMPEHTTIYRWIVKYTKRAIKAFENVHPNVGDVWIADETVLKLKSGGGENIWLFDCIDESSRFLLASYLTNKRYTKDAQTLLERAEKRAGKTPRVVITDKLRSYLDAMEKTFGSESTHHQSGPFALRHSTRSIEVLHGTIKSRTSIMRGLWNRETAQLVMDGWTVHYNFFRPHQGLGGKTPAEVARVDSSYRSWQNVVKTE